MAEEQEQHRQSDSGRCGGRGGDGESATINNGTRHAAVIRLRLVDTSRACGLPPFKIIIAR